MCRSCLPDFKAWAYMPCIARVTTPPPRSGGHGQALPLATNAANPDDPRHRDVAELDILP